MSESKTVDVQLLYGVEGDHCVEFNIARNGGLTVVVTEERAVDSYNATFDCSYHLSPDQAKELRDWLLAHYPK